MQHPLLKQKTSSPILTVENPRDYVPMHAIITSEEKSSKKMVTNSNEGKDAQSGMIWDAPIFTGRDGEIW
ncbi:hypothetical protein [Parasegetibacter sp. NRK P23]|uniref:hypothetical protein n=1 Tax=Parasegetibacter sp. NRK P23 TaxID=2942999 RepID=UPI002043F169|nr:hypothetical protein [Parasegetibacter sp. NRK P23]MCM5528204.1 hypothetical protein [Parasegetibacter sp. NRK P23]